MVKHCTTMGARHSNRKNQLNRKIELIVIGYKLKVIIIIKVITTIRPPVVPPTIFLVFGQECDWSGEKCNSETAAICSSTGLGTMDGPHVGGTSTNKLHDPPGTHMSQRNGHMALDLRSGNCNGSAGPLGWRDLQPRGGLYRSATFRVCSRAMMWSRLAAVPAS